MCQVSHHQWNKRKVDTGKIIYTLYNLVYYVLFINIWMATKIIDRLAVQVLICNEINNFWMKIDHTKIKNKIKKYWWINVMKLIQWNLYKNKAPSLNTVDEIPSYLTVYVLCCI